MKNHSSKFLGLAFAIAALTFSFSERAQAHADKHEDRLLSHFATGSHAIENGKLPDLTHSAEAEVKGAPRLKTIGPAQAFVLDGEGDWFLLGERDAAEKILPKKEFSVAAWVNLNATDEWGGISGLIMDNGNREKGWLLGYNKNTFSFALATKGADDGDGKLTYLLGKTPIQRRQWYYVVATYDGSTMQLYVNGKLEGESKEQSGEIIYPDKGKYVIGTYVDSDEQHLMDGAVYEVKTYARAMPGTEIAQVAEKNRNLVNYVPSTPTLTFLVKPYLQFGTSNSMTIMCETPRPTNMRVDFGELVPLTMTNATTGFSLINELTLTNLAQYKEYFYRVTCTDETGEEVRSELHSFQTVPGAERPWAFGIIGDTQRNPEITRKVAEGVFAVRPSMMIHCGDVVDDGHSKNQWVQDLFEPMSRLLAYVPMYPVIGNHEKNSHWYYDYFSMPKPEYYYTFTYGNAQFFMIDSNKDCGPESEQYKWLEKELAKSKATWKFTAHHHPCFSSDENDYGDHWKGTAKEGFTWGDTDVRQLVPLYEKYGVDIAFAGHIHSYERTWPIWQMSINQKKGVRYIVSGGGGGGLESAAPQRSWFSLHVHRAHHYCLAVIHDRTIEFKAYDADGRLFDNFALTKPDDR